MSRPEPHPDSPQIAPLTALRFFAAAWVVLFHYWPALGQSVTPALAAKGYLGVELFFVLSGFIISYVYQGAVERGRFRYGDFLWARLARIYPLHIATLAGVAALGLAALAIGRTLDANLLNLEALPANLLLVQAWGLSPTASFNHPSWSISAEWFAYLAFPAFAALAARFRGHPGAALGSALLLVLILYAAFERLAGFPLTQATIAWGALRIVPCFALGCAAHLVWRSGALTSRRLAFAGSIGSACAIVLMAELHAYDGLLTATFGTLILSLAGVWSTRPAGRRTGRLTAALAYLGEISFATYMLVIPLKLVVNALFAGPDGAWPPLVWVAAAVALIPLSALAHHLVERPARRWLRTHKPGGAVRAAPATVQPAE